MLKINNWLLSVCMVISIFLFSGCVPNEKEKITIQRVYSIDPELEIDYGFVVDDFFKVIRAEELTSILKESIITLDADWFSGIGIKYSSYDKSKNCFIKEQSCNNLRVTVELSCNNCSDKKIEIKKVVSQYLEEKTADVLKKYINGEGPI